MNELDEIALNELLIMAKEINKKLDIIISNLDEKKDH
jgi:hypothetical protein